MTIFVKGSLASKQNQLFFNFSTILLLFTEEVAEFCISHDVEGNFIGMFNPFVEE